MSYFSSPVAFHLDEQIDLATKPTRIWICTQSISVEWVVLNSLQNICRHLYEIDKGHHPSQEIMTLEELFAFVLWWSRTPHNELST